jgi:hypothetical protein
MSESSSNMEPGPLSAANVMIVVYQADGTKVTFARKSESAGPPAVEGCPRGTASLHAFKEDLARYFMQHPEELEPIPAAELHALMLAMKS